MHLSMLRTMRASASWMVEGVNSFELRYFISAIGSATPFRYGTVLSATIFILLAFYWCKDRDYLRKV